VVHDAALSLLAGKALGALVARRDLIFGRDLDSAHGR
jgi:hypothetical protein